MLILGIDLETTGLDEEKDRITEVGAVLFCTKRHQPIKLFNELIKYPSEETPGCSEEITRITGIDDDLLYSHGNPFSTIAPALNRIIENTDFLCAHNAPFDSAFLTKAFKKAEILMVDRPWIDTSQDIVFPEHITTRKLSYLSYEHGFGNPFSHRAVFDVLTMLKVCDQYNWDEIIARSKIPSITIRAMVTFGNKDLAKERGYRWNAADKTWIKQIKEDELPKEIEEAKFEVRKL